MIQESEQALVLSRPRPSIVSDFRGMGTTYQTILYAHCPCDVPIGRGELSWRRYTNAEQHYVNPTPLPGVSMLSSGPP